MTASAPLWPLVLYSALVVLLAAGMIVVPYFLGQRHRARAIDNTPYESGMLPTGSAGRGASANFYLLGLLFVIFDVESVFIYAWAVSARQGGWPALGGIAVFIALLLAALGYLWGVGALDWGTSARRLKEMSHDTE